MEIMIATIDFNLFSFQIGISNAERNLYIILHLAPFNSHSWFWAPHQLLQTNKTLVNIENADKLIK